MIKEIKEKIFGRQMQMPNKYVVIAPSKKSEGLCILDDANMRMYTYIKDRLVNIEPYSSARAKTYYDDGIPVLYDVKNCEPEGVIILGGLQWEK